MAWHAYDRLVDRAAAHRVLRDGLQRGPVPYTIHPGDWDWWVFHDDPRFASEYLIDDAAGAIAAIAIDQRHIATFGCSVATGIELGGRRLGPGTVTLDIAAQDADGIATVRGLGFERDGEPAPVFGRATADAPATPTLPDGFTIRPVRDETEHASRATAARRAFGSTLDPGMHAARYLRFMRSAAYVPDHDRVVLALDGRVAAFTIVWPDAELSLAQFEPVGTDPDFRRRGLARAVIVDALRHLESMGIRQARVVTNGDNDAAVGLYESCGFTRLDSLITWRGPAAPG